MEEVRQEGVSEAIRGEESSISPSFLETQLRAAEELKSKGNELFQRGITFKGHTLGKSSMIEACTKYAEALEILKEVPREGSGEKQDPGPIGSRKRTLMTSILLNLAACSIELDSPDTAINCCNDVLEFEGNYPKALFRRARALTLQEKFEEALKDFDTAIRQAPGNKELREHYKKVKEKLRKKEEKEALSKQTKEGVRRRKEEQKRKWAENLGLEIFLINGDQLDEYSWGQTLDEIHVLIRPEGEEDVKLKDVSVDINHDRVEVCHKGTIILKKHFKYNIKVDESIWELEEKQCIHLTLHKEHATRAETEPGFEWWPTPFEGDKEIDTSLCKAGMSLSDLPEKQRHKIQEELVKREAEEARAMDNPKKKAIYEMMKEKFPDVPVDIK